MLFEIYLLLITDWSGNTRIEKSRKRIICNIAPELLQPKLSCTAFRGIPSSWLQMVRDLELVGSELEIIQQANLKISPRIPVPMSIKTCGIDLNDVSS